MTMIKLSTLTGRPLLRLVSSLKTQSSTMLAGDSSQVTNLRTLFFKVDFVQLLVNLFTKVFHRRLGGLLHQAGSDRHVHNHDHNYNNHNHHNRCPQEGCGQQEGEEAAQGGLSNENIVGSSMEALCPLDSTNPIPTISLTMFSCRGSRRRLRGRLPRWPPRRRPKRRPRRTWTWLTRNR